ncbi:MAG: pentapeptide repeat-containing protein, partial [Nostoc sp.]
RANLKEAILWNADLRGACLDSAILADASFNGAQNFVIHQYMTGIFFWNTIMPDGSVIEGPVYIN